jgi:hypothetical protein
MMEAIESLTRSIQGNFNRRKEWDAALADAIRLAKARLDEIPVTHWPAQSKEVTEIGQLLKTLNIFESLRDLDDHQ